MINNLACTAFKNLSPFLKINSHDSGTFIKVMFFNSRMLEKIIAMQLICASNFSCCFLPFVFYLKSGFIGKSLYFCRTCGASALC